MFKKILNIPKYLDLKDVGGLELVFALTPMLMSFTLGLLPLSALMWVILIAIVLLRKEKNRFVNFKPLTIFIVYWAAHEIVIMLIDDVNLNNMIVQIIYFASVYFLFPHLNLNKLRGSMNWVALISIVGLIYQWGFIISGQGVHQLEIPGLTISESRLVDSMRPSSFFDEPAAYVAFMICPLALSLIDRKYIWATAIILSVFLTTSTTGIVLSFLMLTMSLFGKKNNRTSALLIPIVGLGLFFSLTHFEAFEAGVEKLETTDRESNVRLAQGPYVVSTMNAEEFVLGAPYSTPYSYCKSGRATNVVFYGESVYLSTFWFIILRFGLLGLALYLSVYLKILKKNRAVLPFVICLFAVLFSSGYGIQSTYIFTLIFLLVMVRNIALPVTAKK